MQEPSDKKTKILWLILTLAILTSIAFTFYKTVILKDFDVIESEVEE